VTSNRRKSVGLLISLRPGDGSIILIVIAVLMFLFVKGDYSTAGAIVIGVLGLTSIAISRRR